DAPGEVGRKPLAGLAAGEAAADRTSQADGLDVVTGRGVAIAPAGRRRDCAPGAEASRRYFSQADYAMKQLASETGARPFFPERVEELDGVYAAIATELSSQYSIGYVPRNVRDDGRYRRVIVRVSERPDLRPRTRTGYFLPAEESVAR